MNYWNASSLSQTIIASGTSLSIFLQALENPVSSGGVCRGNSPTFDNSIVCTDSGMYNKATIQHGINHHITRQLAHKSVLWPCGSQTADGCVADLTNSWMRQKAGFESSNQIFGMIKPIGTRNAIRIGDTSSALRNREHIKMSTLMVHLHPGSSWTCLSMSAPDS